MTLEETVLAFNTKYDGFTRQELEDLMNTFTNLNKERVFDALNGNTGVLIKGEFVRYKHDIVSAIKCGIEDRELTLDEWD